MAALIFSCGDWGIELVNDQHCSLSPAQHRGLDASGWEIGNRYFRGEHKKRKVIPLLVSCSNCYDRSYQCKPNEEGRHGSDSSFITRIAVPKSVSLVAMHFLKVHSQQGRYQPAICSTSQIAKEFKSPCPRFLL